jgi:hypothetical protein
MPNTLAAFHIYPFNLTTNTLPVESAQAVSDYSFDPGWTFQPSIVAFLLRST